MICSNCFVTIVGPEQGTEENERERSVESNGPTKQQGMDKALKKPLQAQQVVNEDKDVNVEGGKSR